MHTRSSSIDCWPARTLASGWRSIWLDLVRYADTIGYHSDNPRTSVAVSRLRDRRVQSNKPFDQFTIEQLAGDLLPDCDDGAKGRLGVQPPASDDRGRRRRSRRNTTRSTPPTACETSRRSGWRRRWAAASATITSSIRSRTKISTAWRRSSPTSRKPAVGKREPGMPVPERRAGEADSGTMTRRRRREGKRSTATDAGARRRAGGVGEGRRRKQVDWKALEPIVEPPAVDRSLARSELMAVIRDEGRARRRKMYTLHADDRPAQSITGFRLEALDRRRARRPRAGHVGRTATSS